MSEDDIAAILRSAGLDRFVPLILLLHTTASLLDAAIPQPATGSHWLPFRKVLSFLALNFGNAANSAQPALTTWLQRLVIVAASRMPAPDSQPTVTQRLIMALAARVPDPNEPPKASP